MSSGMRDARETGGVRSLLRTIRHAVRNILVVGLGFVVVGVILTEAAGILLTRAWPTANVHLAAAAVGLLLGYSAAITAALRETMHGMLSSLSSVERIVTEIEHAGARVTHEVEVLASQPDVKGRHTGTTPMGTMAKRAASTAPGGIGAYRSGGNGAVTMVIGPVDRVVDAATTSQADARGREREAAPQATGAGSR